MKIVAALVALLLFGCATTDYRSYEGNAKQFEGTGGTKVTTDGIDFWSNGSPPRKFVMLGIVTSEIGAGYGDEYMIRSAVSSKVKQAGGDAAIEMNNNTSFAGVLNTQPGVYFAVSARQMKFAVVKYVP